MVGHNIPHFSIHCLTDFQSLESHTTPITALDFSEPYGTLVTASQEDTQPRVWDLLTGEEIGRLRGHRGSVKCMQVEDHICLTGSDDGSVRVWDLRRVDEDEDWESGDMLSLSDVAEEDESAEERTNSSIRQGGSDSSRPASAVEREGPCVRVLEGHSKAVSAMYFEDECLVRVALPTHQVVRLLLNLFRLPALQTRPCGSGT